MFRIGIGRDIHKLEKGRRFILGGVEIPFEKGEAGHSDGDVLIHALIDALLGASALGDIGGFFPPKDSRWKDADSGSLLKIAFNDVKKAGWQIVNIDSVVSCEHPAVLPYREKIRESLAALLEVDAAKIFVKGKSGEGLGEIGRGEAVEAVAVCLLDNEIKN